MLLVLVGGVTGNQEVVQVDKDKGKGTKDGVHEALECLGTIFQAKRHPKKLKGAEWSDNGGFRDMIRMHRDLMVCLCKVDLREDCATLETSREITHEWKLIRVMSRRLVQPTVVATGAPLAIRFWHTMKRRGPRGV